MEKISESFYKDYTYNSRYASFPYYYHNEDDAYFYGTTANLNKNTTYLKHIVKQTDTLDSLAFKYYGRPDLYWAIADFNDIKDPFKKITAEYLLIPTISNISFKG